jgi:hypothetical protein
MCPVGTHLCLKFITIVRTLKRSLVVRNLKIILRENRTTKTSIIIRKTRVLTKAKALPRNFLP